MLQSDDVSVASEELASKDVSGIGCFDGLDQTEPHSNAEQGKLAIAGIVVESGGARAGLMKPPCVEPSVVVAANSPAPPTAGQPTVFVVSDSPAATGVLANDTTMSTGDDDEDTESNSLGKENDHSSAATGLGKNP